MSDFFGFKVSQSGCDVTTADQKNLIITSGLQSVKIHDTGTITVSLPAETLTSTSKTYSGTSAHGLDYPPLCLPAARNVTLDESSTSEIIVNDECYFFPLILGYGPSPRPEVANVVVDDTNIKLTITRFANLTVNYAAHDVTLYYTIFYVDLSAEFNLLA